MLVSDVYRTLWRRKFFVVLITAIVVASAFFLTSQQTKLYTAYSLVRVQQSVQSQNEVFGALVTGERLARTYERIAETYSVREIVNAELPRGISSGDAAIDARQLSNLELLQVAVTDPDPRTAAVVANAVPKALASFIKTTGTFRDTITVVERASPPTIPSSPNLRLNITLALMLGLILGGALALLKESVSDRIEDVEELERSTRHPVIATIPNLKFVSPKPEPRSKSDSKRVEPIPRKVDVTQVGAADASASAARWGARG